MTIVRDVATVIHMTADPRAALDLFVRALERHLEAASASRGTESPAVVQAYQDVSDAFEHYDNALLEAFGEVTPLELYHDDDEDDEDGDFDEDDDDTDPDEDLEYDA